MAQLPRVEQQQLFTIPEAARLLDVGESKIRRALRADELARAASGPRAVITFERAELERYRGVLVRGAKDARGKTSAAAS